jgi:hypothetical protein
VPAQVGVVKRYNAEDAVEGLLAQVRRELGLDPAAHFTRISPKPGERCAPPPCGIPVHATLR